MRGGLLMPLLPQQQRSMILLKNALIAGINLSSKFNAPGQPSGIEVGQPIFGSSVTNRVPRKTLRYSLGNKTFSWPLACSLLVLELHLR